ncbi:MAG: histidine phosphatase family protein, partial [Clostridia bacterium]|nr:histidine phosphatase family protein [Clostridia bacterium]
MRIYTIRHGESYSNTGGTVMSYTDMPLTDKGREQVRRAGLSLKEALKTDAPLYIAEKQDIFFFESLEADPTALIIRPARVLKRELLCFRPDKTRTEET